MRRLAPALLPLVLVGGPVGAAALWAVARAGVLVVGADGAWPSVFMLLVAAPVVEEYVFREWLQGWLAGLSRRGGQPGDRLVTPANALASLAFCACHAVHQPLPMALAVLAPSLVLGRLREVSGSIGACMAAHAWFNACFLVATRW